MERKTLHAKISADGGANTFEATITTPSLDRDSEVLLPEGMDATDWLKNPVILWNHDPGQPIGTGSDLKRRRGEWKATGTLAQRPESHPDAAEWFPDTVHSLMKQGVIGGVSVGFIPSETRRPTGKDRATFGENVSRVFNKWKLLEFSVTPLPANQDALITSVSKGLIGRERAIDLFGDIPDGPVVVPSHAIIRSRIKRVVKSPVLVDQNRLNESLAKKQGKIYV